MHPSARLPRRRRLLRLALHPGTWFGGGLLFCAALYWPGLAGSYLFDDFPNIVENRDLHVDSLHWADWKIAMLSSPSAELRRPLAMLSFALNYYCTGLAPWPMKLTNLLLHLLDGVLLCLALRVLLELWNRRRSAPLANSRLAWTATWISLAWLLCPINLSPVLYVVQRMESLAQTFVLAGLLGYLYARRRMLDGRSGQILAAASLLCGAGLGALCKESALLLPLYALLLEVCVLEFGPRAARPRLLLCYGALLLAPGLIGVAWELPRALAPGAYASRAFTLGERLLTECRVVVDYLGWTLAPRPGTVGFYHDDIALSTGWLNPPATLASATLLAGLLAGAAALRRRCALASLGICWYFAAHLLTATIIPLELVFEHRNYFASIGVLLAVAALVLELPPRLHGAGGYLAAAMLALYAMSTGLRAILWGNPIRFAYAEAREHPESSRAAYELGRALVIASGYRPDSRLVGPAMQALETAAALPGTSLLPDAALIIVAGHLHRPTQPRWWQDLTRKLGERAPAVEDISALSSLADCQRKSDCPRETGPLLTAFLTALSHGNPGARLLGIYGAFAANELGDYPLAARSLADAARLSPETPAYRLDLVSVLILEGDLAGASGELAKLQDAALNSADRTRARDLAARIRSHAAAPWPPAHSAAAASA